jgi:hypothetical protein
MAHAYCTSLWRRDGSLEQDIPFMLIVLMIEFLQRNGNSFQ